MELAEGRTLHIHTDNRKETEAWLNALRTARNAGKSLEDQLLTKVGIIPFGYIYISMSTRPNTREHQSRVGGQGRWPKQNPKN